MGVRDAPAAGISELISPMAQAVRMHTDPTAGSSGGAGGRNWPGRAMRHAGGESGGEQVSQRSAGQRKRQRFAQNHAQDVAVGKTESLQHADFADSLAHGHRHGISADQQDGEHDGGRDTDEEHLHVSEKSSEAQQVRLLALGLGLLGGVAEFVVDGLRDASRRPGVVDQHGKHAGRPAAIFRQRLLQVLPAEIHGLGIAIGIEDPADGELVIAGIDVAHQGQFGRPRAG